MLLITPILEDAESDGNSRKFLIGVTRQGSFPSLCLVELVERYDARESPNQAVSMETLCKTLHELCFFRLIMSSQLIKELRACSS